MTEKPLGKPQPEEVDGDDSCFVIMPFGGWYDQYYQAVFKPAISDAGLKPRRADDLYRPGTIINDIWSQTRDATVVLADLSTKNANVLYELGLAHAIGKPVVIVSESVDDVPFDLRALRVIEYDKNAHDWGSLLAESITKAIEGAMDVPLSFVLPTFIDADEDSERPTVAQSELNFLELRQELDQLRREVRLAGRPLVESERPRIAQRDAELLVRDLVNDGVPDRIIHNRLIRQGAPEDWVGDEISKQKVRMRSTSRPPVNLEAFNKGTLLDMARAREIRGRSKMSKAELINALE